MGDGPPRFRRDCSCPAVLRIRPGGSGISTTWLSHPPAGRSRPHSSMPLLFDSYLDVLQPRSITGLGSFRFARRYLGNRSDTFIAPCFLLLRVLRCFSSPGLPSITYGFSDGSCPPRTGGCPIRRSPDHSLLTAPRGISVFVPSFVGS